ncbi:MAG: copper chaperone PCu(A)C [Chloroflexi bacterium]|nr:copper chaperone PCu(A)C [Chloroflexota bacterium]MCC6896853.1 copper chaperone PCu(A)C [Anaerolineae bacterium]
MKIKWLAWITICLVLIAPLGISAAYHGDECHLAALFNGYARSTPEGAPTGAVFGLLVNLGAETDTVLSITTPAADAAEMHEMVVGEGDVMQMRPVEGGFVVPSSDFLTLAPGGLHIMLIGLKQPLVAGETLDLLLTFEHAGEVAVQVPVVDMTAVEGGMAQPENEMTAEPAAPSTTDWGACAGLHVVGAWARPANAAMPNSAAYALLLNLTDTDNVLVSAEGTVSEAIELHEMIMGDGDVMQMRPVEGGIPVPAGAAVELRPGGLHVMLIGLKGELAVGSTIDLTLNFAAGEPLTVTLPVREPVEAPAAMPGG